ncbi:alpha/beta hydrolase [Nocardiopsis sp. RSe5-2]|uniref:Alpha/beta hydrolase n=1 Tax=Nocardiopsis endophytica TaxID=3018445 RepID=A0ABT4UAA0_9ACTN|nr:alpha/beta hydrolase [Nocardiopsis endophytica]MDA2813884.1 alpha/beta hydrolase [Nocardiopsis endophytica]
MDEPSPDTLRVPGAALHYETRGEGPLLLVIPGGSGVAEPFDGLAERLAAQFTVAVLEPRGAPRSPLDDPDAEQSVEEHADDALRLLDLLSPDAPAAVFGSSSGAITTLALTARHPDRVRRAVTHEPPVVEVLPDAERHRRMFDEVHRAFRSGGVEAAIGVMAEGFDAPAETPARLPGPEAMARMHAGMPFFLDRIVPRFTRFVPDTEALRGSGRLIPAHGESTRGRLPARPAEHLAGLVGHPAIAFPGGHLGYTSHPEEFAAALAPLLVP